MAICPAAHILMTRSLTSTSPSQGMQGLPPDRGSRRSLSSLPTDSEFSASKQDVFLELFGDEHVLLDDLVHGFGNLVALGTVAAFLEPAFGGFGEVPHVKNGEAVEPALELAVSSSWNFFCKST